MPQAPTVAELVDQFKLKERARARGIENLPASDSRRLDGPETEVVEHCGDLFTDRLTEYNRHRASFEERMRKLETAGADAAGRDDLVERACLDMKEAVDEERTELEDRARTAQKAIGDVHQFRREEGLTRDADYPDNRWLLGGLLAVLVLVETAINGLFFGANVSGGMVAGTSYAVLISAVNVVALGWLAALLLRMTRHGDPLQKIAGWIGLAFVVAVALAFNFLVGHYREALAVDYPPEPVATVVDSEAANAGAEACWRGPDEADADQEALCLFMQNPVRLGGFYSYLLLLIGVLWWLAGTADWFKLDDPYPGYGKKDRRRRKAERKLSDERTEMLEDLKEIHDRGRNELARTFTDPLDSWQLAQNDFGSLERKHRDFAEFARSLEASVRGTLDIYRNTNEEHRTTREPPAWEVPWTSEWTLPDAPTRERLITVGRLEVEEMSRKLRTARSDRRAMLLAGLEEQRNLVNRFTKLDYFDRAGPR
jgi:hypothetical protein